MTAEEQNRYEALVDDFRRMLESKKTAAGRRALVELMVRRGHPTDSPGRWLFFIAGALMTIRRWPFALMGEFGCARGVLERLDTDTPELSRHVIETWLKVADQKWP